MQQLCKSCRTCFKFYCNVLFYLWLLFNKTAVTSRHTCDMCLIFLKDKFRKAYFTMSLTFAQWRLPREYSGLSKSFTLTARQYLSRSQSPPHLHDALLQHSTGGGGSKWVLRRVIYRAESSAHSAWEMPTDHPLLNRYRRARVITKRTCQVIRSVWSDVSHLAAVWEGQKRHWPAVPQPDRQHSAHAVRRPAGVDKDPSNEHLTAI